MTPMSTQPTVCAALRWATVRLQCSNFVNREVAAWIELQAKGDKGYAKRRRLGLETAATSVSLAGTSHTSSILSSVVFDLTFLNEVTQSHETIRNIHAKLMAVNFQHLKT